MAMKKFVTLLCAIMAIFAGSSSDASEVNVQSGLHLDWWDGDNDQTGLQFFIPIEVSSVYKDCSINLIGAYLYTEVDPDTGDKRSISQMTDTKLNLSYGLYDKLPFDVLIGLGFNLPTGHTDLTPNETVLVVPPDLFTIPTFGEGLNINPTVSIAKDWGAWITGLSIGYTFRGEYDYSYLYEDFDPGDIFTLTAEIGHDFTQSLSGKLYGQFIDYGKDSLDGDDLYEEGRAKLLGIGMSYKQQNWDMAFSLSGIMRDKNKIREGTAFPVEAKNSHGNEFYTSLSGQYRTDPNTAFKSSLQFLFIDENDYPSGSAYYVGKRQKITLGCGVERAFAQGFRGLAGIDGFIMNDDGNWYHPGEDVTYKGLSISAQVSKSF